MITPATLKQSRQDLGLSQEGFARFLRMRGEHAGRTVRRWEAGTLEIPGYVALVLELITLLSDRARNSLLNRRI